MRTIAIGDIHGGLRGLKQLLELVELEKSDETYFSWRLCGWLE